MPYTHAPRRISLARRAVQLATFALIVYGGFVLARPLELKRGEMVDESGFAGKFERSAGTRLVTREPPVVDTFLPATSCYYQHRGFFSGCSLAWLSEHIGFLTPLYYLVPQLLLLLALMFFFGRLWCGWVCPFGFLSDVLSWIRQLVGRDHLQVSRRLRDGLVITKYVLLGATLILSVLAAVPALARHKADLILPFCQVCFGKFASPFLSGAAICWTNFQSAVGGTLTVLGLCTFVVFFGGLFVRRLYCRICPIGGLTAPFNRIGLTSLHKRAAVCTDCGACARVCPVDNLVVVDRRDDGPVNACECVLCLRCIEACPEKGALELSIGGKVVVRS